MDSPPDRLRDLIHQQRSDFRGPPWARAVTLAITGTFEG